MFRAELPEWLQEQQYYLLIHTLVAKPLFLKIFVVSSLRYYKQHNTSLNLKETIKNQIKENRHNVHEWFLFRVHAGHRHFLA